MAAVWYTPSGDFVSFVSISILMRAHLNLFLEAVHELKSPSFSRGMWLKTGGCDKPEMYNTYSARVFRVVRIMARLCSKILLTFLFKKWFSRRCL